MLHAAKQIAVFVAVAYLAVVAAMFLLQRKLQYFPDTYRYAPEDVELSGVEAIEIGTQDGETLVGWYSPPRDGAPVVLYFHGNAGSIANRWPRMAVAQMSGYGMLLVSYRGYGGSTGKPTQDGLIRDARAALDALHERGAKQEDIVYYGESLGTGVAVALAAERPPMALVLEAPFTSAADIAAEVYWWIPVKALMRDQFDSMSKIGALDVPLLVLHGDRDTVIPVRFGRRLYAAAPGPKEMIELPGSGHSLSVDEALWARITGFVEQHRGR